MKNRLLFMFLFFIPYFIEAQSFNSGMRIGIVGSQVDGDSYEGFNKAGLTGGIYVNHKIAEQFSLQMEMNYIQKGSRKPVDLNGSFYLMRVNYLEVPLILHWHVNSMIDIFGGPSYAILLNSYEENEFGVYQGPAFNSYEVAARIGLSYKLSDQWKVDGRYCNSITTIRPAPYSYSPYLEKGQYNRYVEIGLSYDF